METVTSNLLSELSRKTQELTTLLGVVLSFVTDPETVETKDATRAFTALSKEIAVTTVFLELVANHIKTLDDENWCALADCAVQTSCGVYKLANQVSRMASAAVMTKRISAEVERSRIDPEFPKPQPGL